jgi:hypothetical protein
VRVLHLDSTANELLGLSVGDGDRCLIWLELSLHARLEVTQGGSARQVGGLDGEIKVPAQALGHLSLLYSSASDHTLGAPFVKRGT